MARKKPNDINIKLIWEDLDSILWWDALNQAGKNEVKKLYFPDDKVTNENVKYGYRNTLIRAELAVK